MINPVEGIHYIFDRYDFINTILSDNGKTGLLDNASAPEDIGKAIKYCRALFHPDRQERSGEKMKREAERMSVLVDDCERILANPDVKPHYDQKLAEFKDNKPKLVSDSGMPIIDLGSEMMDIESLLTDDVADTKDFEDRVKAMLQYDEKNVTQTRSLFDTMGDNPQIRSLYRDALTKKLTYLTLLEDAAWLKIGIHGRKSKIDGHLMNSEDYTAKVEEALRTVATTKIEENLNQRGDMARIGMGSLPLLLTFNDAAGPAEAPAPSTALVDPAAMRDILEKLKTKARANFEIRAEYVRDVARLKQAVLEELVSLTPVTALNDHDANSSRYDFYLTEAGDDGQVLLRLELDVKTGNAALSQVYRDELTVSELQAGPLSVNSFRVEKNPEISDILIEVSGASEVVFQKYKGLFAEAAPDDTEPPAPQP